MACTAFENSFGIKLEDATLIPIPPLHLFCNDTTMSPQARPTPIPSEDVVSGKASSCDNCGDMFRRTFKCGFCKVSKYCSKDCQKADWQRHKTQCGRLSQGLPGPRVETVDNDELNRRREAGMNAADILENAILADSLLILCTTGFTGICLPHCMASPKNTTLDKKAIERVCSWFGNGTPLLIALDQAFKDGKRLSRGMFGSVWIDVDVTGADGRTYETRFGASLMTGTRSGYGFVPDPTGDERLFE